ncbi:galactose-specific lectin nattectin [Spinachia spinachia]
MKVLGVSLVLSSLLALTLPAPLNFTGGLAWGQGLCVYERMPRPPGAGPQCDANGNFLPQQCSGSTGYCWCVNVVTGVEIPNTATLAPAVPVNCAGASVCPGGWSHHRDQCFVFISSMKTWAEAEGYCLFEGANLASAHSPEENHFLRDLTKADGYQFPPTWIGGNDGIHVGYWMWSDGSRFDYENWAPGHEPGSPGRCLQMNSGFLKKWNNASCNETLPFICAKAV